jgi:hypothetical protein
VFGIELPFLFARGAHADHADRFQAERNEDNCDDAVDIHPNGAPASAMGWTDQSVIKEGLVEVVKIKTVLAKTGQTLRLVSHDFHRVLL